MGGASLMYYLVTNVCGWAYMSAMELPRVIRQMIRFRDKPTSFLWKRHMLTLYVVHQLAPYRSPLVVDLCLNPTYCKLDDWHLIGVAPREQRGPSRLSHSCDSLKATSRNWLGGRVKHHDDATMLWSGLPSRRRVGRTPPRRIEKVGFIDAGYGCCWQVTVVSWERQS
jgi:hypothetical protein